MHQHIQVAEVKKNSLRVIVSMYVTIIRTFHSILPQYMHTKRSFTLYIYIKASSHIICAQSVLSHYILCVQSVISHCHTIMCTKASTHITFCAQSVLSHCHTAI